MHIHSSVIVMPHVVIVIVILCLNMMVVLLFCARGCVFVCLCVYVSLYPPCVFIVRVSVSYQTLLLVHVHVRVRLQFPRFLRCRCGFVGLACVYNRQRDR